MTIAPDLTKTVTAGDANPEPNSFGYMNFYPFFRQGVAWNGTLLPELPLPGTLSRDYVLSSTLDYPGFWSAAVNIAVSQFVTKSFDLKGTVPLAIKRAWELLEQANGGEGLEHLQLQFAMDYFTTNNGAFIEVVRVADSPAAKIIGLYHLDSLRCRRTGNPETPVCYWNTYDSSWHFLKWYQVFSISDAPNARSNYVGVGHCAAERSYDRIRRMQAIERFIFEKITGGGPQKIVGITGMSQTHLENMLTTDAAQRNASGLAVYGGTAMFAFMSKDGIQKVEIDIASLPENFEAKEEISQALLMYADSLGIDPQELQPLHGSALGTSAQSHVLEDKAKSKGLALLIKRWTKFLNQWVLPQSVTAVYVEKDLRDTAQKAAIFTQYATAITTLMEKGLLDKQQAMQVMVDHDQLPQIFLPVDNTPEMSFAYDTEKPDFAAEAAPPQTMLEKLLAATKEVEEARKVYKEVLSA